MSRLKYVIFKAFRKGSDVILFTNIVNDVVLFYSFFFIIMR